MRVFKTGQAWRTRKGDIVEITVRDDGKILFDGGFCALEPHGKFYYEGSALNSPFDLMEQVTRVYIGGPMSGLPEKNYPAFAALAQVYRDRGCFVINPATLHGPEEKTHAEYMRTDIAALVTCDMLALLPGWELSGGASAEVTVATVCGLAIVWPEPKSSGCPCDPSGSDGLRCPCPKSSELLCSSGVRNG